MVWAFAAVHHEILYLTVEQQSILQSDVRPSVWQLKFAKIVLSSITTIPQVQQQLYNIVAKEEIMTQSKSQNHNPDQNAVEEPQESCAWMNVHKPRLSQNIVIIS